MSQNTKIPTLRFKGFTDPWEQRKLEEVLEIIKDGTHGTHKDTEEGPFLLSAKNIKNGAVVWDESDRRISYDDYEKIHSNFKLKINDVLLTIVGSIGETAILKDNSYITFQRSVAFLRPSAHITSEFLFFEIQTSNFQKRLNDNKSTSAQPGIYLGSLSEMPFSYPKNKEEQCRIGSYLEYVDSIITLHQRKCDQLITIKKALLQKMFPKSGSNIPVIRFKGFTAPWKQRKVNEVCSITTGKSNTQDQVIDGAYPFFIRSDIPVRSNRWLYDEEAVITIGDGNIGKVFHYINGKFDLHQRCYKMSSFKELTGKYFFYYFSKAFYKRAMSMSAKATVDSVRLEMIADMLIQYPKSIEEQTKIEQVLSHLDSLITLYQRKVDILNKVKKSMLQRMFV